MAYHVLYSTYIGTYALNGGDTLTVTSTGEIAAIEGFGITVSSSNSSSFPIRLNIDGEVSGEDAVFITLDGTNLSVGPNGVLTGDTGAGVRLGTGNVIDSQGSIRGDLAINSQGGDEISNSGTISGLDLGILENSGSNRIQNSGDISGGNSAAIVIGGGSNSIENSGIISAGAHASPSSGSTFYSAIRILGNANSITNTGTISCSFGAAVFSFNSDTLTNYGAITCTKGWGFYEYGGGATITNGGRISSNGYDAIRIKGDSNTIVNTGDGTISGPTGISISTVAGLTSRIFNSGTITGIFGDAIQLAAGNEIIHNDNIIAGDIDFGAGSATLFNNGHIGGDVTASGAGTDIDSFINRGIIDGDVTLGSGNDTFRGASGNVSGTVNGGAGNDVLTGGADGETLLGGGGNDILRGGGGNDVLNPNTGTDTVNAGDGDDTIVMAAALTAGDRINGGDGNDTVTLSGDYSAGLTIAAHTLTDVEDLTLASGHDYNLVLARGNIATGATLTVDGSALKASDTLSFDASAVKDASVELIGGKGADTLTGGAGADIITGGLGADTLNGGGGTDTFVYTAVNQSDGANHDTISGFNASADLFDLSVAVSGIDAALTTGKLSSTNFDGSLKTAIGTALDPHHAILFTASAGDLKGHTFLLVDANGTAGYQAGQDYVFELLAETKLAALSASDFI